MQEMIRHLAAVAVLSALFACAQGRDGEKPAERVIDPKHGFSVARPDRWYALTSGDTPCFFNFRAEDFRAQDVPYDGGLPANGASICMMAAGGGPARQGELSRWAAKIVAARHGTAVQEHSVDGPPAQGLEVTFEQPPVGVPGVTLSTVLVAWRLSEIVFGAELTYIKGDPHSADYERTLLGVVRSFRRP